MSVTIFTWFEYFCCVIMRCDINRINSNLSQNLAHFRANHTKMDNFSIKITRTDYKPSTLAPSCYAFLRLPEETHYLSSG